VEAAPAQPPVVEAKPEPVVTVQPKKPAPPPAAPRKPAKPAREEDPDVGF
jgi:hypothetical protein